MANNSDHHFSPDVAMEFGIESAILIHNLQFWIRKNIANETHYHEGRTWTYNKLSAWGKLFPYMKPDRLKNSLLDLVKKGVLIRGEFNKTPYDHTSWYAFSDESAWVKSAKKGALVDKSPGSDREEPGLRSSINIHIENTDRKRADHFLDQIASSYREAAGALDQHFGEILSDARWKLTEDQVKAALRQYVNWLDDKKELKGETYSSIIDGLIRWANTPGQAERLKDPVYVEENRNEWMIDVNWYKREQAKSKGL